MTCNNCGVENNDDAVFCKNCGTKLTKPATEASVYADVSGTTDNTGTTGNVGTVGNTTANAASNATANTATNTTANTATDNTGSAANYNNTNASTTPTTYYSNNAAGTYNVNANQSNYRGYSIASLVLGICSILCCTGCLIGLACGILAIIFYRKEKIDGYDNGLMKAGLVCGIIGAAISLLYFIYWIVCCAIAGSFDIGRVRWWSRF